MIQPTLIEIEDNERTEATTREQLEMLLAREGIEHTWNLTRDELIDEIEKIYEPLKNCYNCMNLVDMMCDRGDYSCRRHSRCLDPNAIDFWWRKHEIQ